MAKVTEKYEVVIVFSLSGGEDNVKALIDKFSVLVGKNTDSFETDDWGKKKLAYPINDETEGYYFLFKFDAAPEFPAELNRVLKITDGVLRSLVTLRR